MFPGKQRNSRAYVYIPTLVDTAVFFVSNTKSSVAQFLMKAGTTAGARIISGYHSDREYSDRLV